jgi:hypothetical protein
MYRLTEMIVAAAFVCFTNLFIYSLYIWIMECNAPEAEPAPRDSAEVQIDDPVSDAKINKDVLIRCLEPAKMSFRR